MLAGTPSSRSASPKAWCAMRADSRSSMRAAAASPAASRALADLRWRFATFTAMQAGGVKPASVLRELHGMAEMRGRDLELAELAEHDAEADARANLQPVSPSATAWSRQRRRSASASSCVPR
jgi:hypothetical protein